MVKKRLSKLKYYQAVGRRKEAVAIVRLHILGKKTASLINGKKVKKGEIFINDKPIEKVYPSKDDQFKYRQPLQLADSEERFVITIKVKGGGKQGQLGAIKQALARAIEKVDKEKYRPILKKEGLLTRDARVRERRKVGMGGKARRKRQSPKR